jgi:hypothetical protein
VAALEIHGPTLRVTASRLPEILSQAEECAGRIMTRIGGVVPCTCEACSSRSSNTVVDWARHVAMSREHPAVEEDDDYLPPRERELQLAGR